MLSRWLGHEPDFRVEGHFSAPEEALAALRNMTVDLILLDYDLGGTHNGFQFVRAARDAGYTGRIFFVTAGMNDAEYVRALGLGVCGIFLKQSPPDMLIQAIHRVMAGETWIDPSCLQGLLKAIETDSSRSRQQQLSDREREVLKRVFAGLSNKEIAAQMNLSEASVKSALQQLFVKTGVRTRSQLVRVALEEYGTLWNLNTEA